MPAVRRRAAVLLTAAALVTSGCDGGDDRDPPAATGSATTPAASSSAPVAAAATVRAEVSSGDVAAAGAVLRARLTALELVPGEPRVSGRTVTFAVARALTPAEAAGLAQRGRLAFRVVTEQLRPDGKAAGAPEGSCRDAAYRAELAEAAAEADGKTVACDNAGAAKYALGAPEEHGGVASAGVGDSGGISTGEPLVQVRLKDAAAWQRLTERVAGRQLAIVVDGAVYSAPTIEGPIPGGEATISGSVTVEAARLLAAVLTGGPLEATVTVPAG